MRILEGHVVLEVSEIALLKKWWACLLMHNSVQSSLWARFPLDSSTPHLALLHLANAVL